MVDPSGAYLDERCAVSDDDLASWHVTQRGLDDELPLEIEGTCPKCGHMMQAEVHPVVVSEALAGDTAMDPREWMTRVIECACRIAHPVVAGSSGDGSTAPATTAATCGRWWLVSVSVTTAVGMGRPVRAAYDDSLLAAAQAHKAAVADESARTRAAAEKWIAGVTALIGTFGLAGVALGKDGVGTLPMWAKSLAGAAVTAALVAAVLAIVNSYQAAYGWPVVIDTGDDVKLRAWYEGRSRQLGVAIQHFKNGVYAAIAAVGLLAFAVVLVLFWPHDAPEPAIQIVRTDESTVCGHLLDTRKAPEVRVRKSGGDVVSVVPADIRAVKAVADCEA